MNRLKDNVSIHLNDRKEIVTVIKKLSTLFFPFFVDLPTILRQISIQEAIESIDVVNSIHLGKSKGLFVDSRKTQSIDKAARNYYSLSDTKPGFVAMVILIDSNFSKVIANFFLGFSKPHFPYKLFLSKKETIKCSEEKIN
jgi:hypothetical protein